LFQSSKQTFFRFAETRLLSDLSQVVTALREVPRS